MEVRSILSRIYRWEHLSLCLIVAITLAMHFSIITQVSDPILDELHYVKSSRHIISGDVNPDDSTNRMELRPEHPPLAKLFIVGGMDAFGDNPWGWRVPSIIMGTIGITLFYFICRRLKMSRRATNIATFLLAFENFTFMLASVAMLDVFFVTFTLAFFLLYLYRQYFLSGIFVGLAALAKLFAALGTFPIFIHWLFTKTKHNRWFLLTVITAPVSFVAFTSLLNYPIFRRFENPLNQIKEMLSLSGSLKFTNTTHPALSRPWEWLLNYEPMAFWYSPHYTGGISLSVWVFMIPVALYMLYRTLKGNDAGLFGFSWFVGTFLLWIPISIFTDRVSFIYYIYPTIGALCLGLGLGLNEALEWVPFKTRRVKIPVMTGVAAFFLFHIASFVVMTPVFIRT